jgi:hypothetical protein
MWPVRLPAHPNAADSAADAAGIFVSAAGANGVDTGALKPHPGCAVSNSHENGPKTIARTTLAEPPADADPCQHRWQPGALLSGIDARTSCDRLAMDDNAATLYIVTRNSGGEGLLPDDEFLELREVPNS